MLANYTANYTYAEGGGMCSIIQFNGIIFKSVEHARVRPSGQMCVFEEEQEEA